MKSNTNNSFHIQQQQQQLQQAQYQQSMIAWQQHNQHSLKIHSYDVLNDSVLSRQNAFRLQHYLGRDSSISGQAVLKYRVREDDDLSAAHQHGTTTTVGAAAAAAAIGIAQSNHYGHSNSMSQSGTTSSQALLSKNLSRVESIVYDRLMENKSAILPSLSSRKANTTDLIASLQQSRLKIQKGLNNLSQYHHHNNNNSMHSSAAGNPANNNNNNNQHHSTQQEQWGIVGQAAVQQTQQTNSSMSSSTHVRLKKAPITGTSNHEGENNRRDMSRTIHYRRKSTIVDEHSRSDANSLQSRRTVEASNHTHRRGLSCGNNTNLRAAVASTTATTAMKATINDNEQKNEANYQAATMTISQDFLSLHQPSNKQQQQLQRPMTSQQQNKQSQYTRSEAALNRKLIANSSLRAPNNIPTAADSTGSEECGINPYSQGLLKIERFLSMNNCASETLIIQPASTITEQEETANNSLSNHTNKQSHRDSMSIPKGSSTPSKAGGTTSNEQNYDINSSKIEEDPSLIGKKNIAILLNKRPAAPNKELKESIHSSTTTQKEVKDLKESNTIKDLKELKESRVSSTARATTAATTEKKSLNRELSYGPRRVMVASDFGIIDNVLSTNASQVYYQPKPSADMLVINQKMISPPRKRPFSSAAKTETKLLRLSLLKDIGEKYNADLRDTALKLKVGVYTQSGAAAAAATTATVGAFGQSISLKSQLEELEKRNVLMGSGQDSRSNIHIGSLVGAINNNNNHHNSSLFPVNGFSATTNSALMGNAVGTVFSCYFVRGNNSGLVRRVLLTRPHWKEATENNSNVNFRWFPFSKGINFGHMSLHKTRMVNHFEFHAEITTKNGLIKNLGAYCSERKMSVFDLTPCTFLFNVKEKFWDLELLRFCDFFYKHLPLHLQGRQEYRKSTMEIRSKFRNLTIKNSPRKQQQQQQQQQQIQQSASSVPSQTTNSTQQQQQQQQPQTGNSSSTQILQQQLNLFSQTNPPQTSASKKRSMTVNSNQPLPGQQYGEFKLHPTFLGKDSNYIWLLKPTNLNRGRGIELFQDLPALETLLNNYITGFPELPLDQYPQQPQQPPVNNKSASMSPDMKSASKNQNDKILLSQLTKDQQQELANPHLSKDHSEVTLPLNNHSQSVPLILTAQKQQQQSNQLEPTDETIEHQNNIQSISPTKKSKSKGKQSKQSPHNNQRSTTTNGFLVPSCYFTKKLPSKFDSQLTNGINPSATGAMQNNTGTAAAPQQVQTPYLMQETSFVIQKYIEKPLLIGKRKFDIRMWVVVTQKMEVYLFSEGYIRMSSEEYNAQDATNIFVHLTNNAIQKYSTKYGALESGNQLSLEQFDKYFAPFRRSFKVDVMPSIQSLIKDSLLSVRSKLNPNDRKYCFELFGYDFFIDEDFHVWLIEVNTNPCIEESSPLLETLLPRMIDDALKLTVDVIFPPPPMSMPFNLSETHAGGVQHHELSTGSASGAPTLFPVPKYKDNENMFKLLVNLKDPLIQISTNQS